MKKIKLLTIITVLALVLQLPITAYADATTYSPYKKAYYSQQAKMQEYTVEHGLDLSYHNGTVDFNKLKEQGVTYVILRVGYRGYGESGKMTYDLNFDKFYQDARAAGLKIGTYFYSQALNVTEAKAEANKMLGKIKGLRMDLPVYFDYEFAGVSDGRLDSAWNKGTVTRQIMTNCVNAFCGVIRDAGFTPGLYSNTDFLTYKYYVEDIDKDISVWNAHYTSARASGTYYATGYKGDYDMWQYSSTGTVYGVHLEKSDNPNGTKQYVVDCNFMYKELMNTAMKNTQFEVSSITARGYTGKAIKPELTVKVGTKTLTKGEDYYVTFENNIAIGTASVTVTGVNNYEYAKPVTKTFKIVPSKLQGLTLSSKNSNSLTFKWDKHPDATRYRVQTLEGDAYKTYKETTDTSCTITSLKPCQSKTVRVTAIKVVNGKDYIGKYSDGVEAVITPAKITNLRNVTNNTDSIKLQWTAQEYASYYRVYQYNSETNKYVCIKKASKNYFTVKDLKMNAQYSFKVRAVKELSDGSTVMSEPCTALVTYTSPDKPTIKSATSGSAKRITVKWAKAAGADGYEVMWSTSKNFSSNFLSTYVTGTAKTLKTSQSKKTYYVRVRAYKIHNGVKTYSKWSSTLSVKVK